MMKTNECKYPGCFNSGLGSVELCHHHSRNQNQREWFHNILSSRPVKSNYHGSANVVISNMNPKASGTQYRAARDKNHPAVMRESSSSSHNHRSDYYEQIIRRQLSGHASQSEGVHWPVHNRQGHVQSLPVNGDWRMRQPPVTFNTSRPIYNSAQPMTIGLRIPNAINFQAQGHPFIAPPIIPQQNIRSFHPTLPGLVNVPRQHFQALNNLTHVGNSPSLESDKRTKSKDENFSIFVLSPNHRKGKTTASASSVQQQQKSEVVNDASHSRSWHFPSTSASADCSQHESSVHQIKHPQKEGIVLQSHSTSGQACVGVQEGNSQARDSPGSSRMNTLPEYSSTSSHLDPEPQETSVASESLEMKPLHAQQTVSPHPPVVGQKESQQEELAECEASGAAQFQSIISDVEEDDVVIVESNDSANFVGKKVLSTGKLAEFNMKNEKDKMIVSSTRKPTLLGLLQDGLTTVQPLTYTQQLTNDSSHQPLTVSSDEGDSEDDCVILDLSDDLISKAEAGLLDDGQRKRIKSEHVADCFEQADQAEATSEPNATSMNSDIMVLETVSLSEQAAVSIVEASSAKTYSQLSSESYYRCSCIGGRCGFRTVLPTQFELHLHEAHPDENTYACVHCGKQETGLDSFMSHLEKHVNHSVLLCCSESTCDFRSFDPETLLKHIAVNHSGICIYTCWHCGLQADTYAKFSSHLDQNFISIVRCRYCSAKDIESDIIIKHMDASHPDQNCMIGVQKVLLCKDRKENRWGEKNSDDGQSVHDAADIMQDNTSCKDTQNSRSHNLQQQSGLDRLIGTDGRSSVETDCVAWANLTYNTLKTEDKSADVTKIMCIFCANISLSVEDHIRHVYLEHKKHFKGFACQCCNFISLNPGTQNEHRCADSQLEPSQTRTDDMQIPAGSVSQDSQAGSVTLGSPAGFVSQDSPAGSMSPGSPASFVSQDSPAGSISNNLTGSVPQGSPAVSIPQGSPAVSVTLGSPAGSVSQGSPAGSVPQGSPAGSVSYSLAGSVPQDSPAGSVSHDSPAHSVPQDNPAHSVPQDSQTSSVSHDSPAHSVFQDNPAYSVPQDNSTGSVSQDNLITKAIKREMSPVDSSVARSGQKRVKTYVGSSNKRAKQSNGSEIAVFQDSDTEDERLGMQISCNLCGEQEICFFKMQCHVYRDHSDVMLCPVCGGDQSSDRLMYYHILQKHPDQLSLFDQVKALNHISVKWLSKTVEQNDQDAEPSVSDKLVISEHAGNVESIDVGLQNQITDEQNSGVLLFCTLCNFSSHQQSKLQKHIYNTHKEAMKCPICSFCLNDDLSLQKHLSAEHIEEKDFLYHMYRSVNWIISVTKNRDEMLPETVQDSVGNYDDEMQNEGQWMQCKVCSFSSHISMSLHDHIYTEHKETMKCPECSLALNSDVDFSEHLSASHIEKKEALYDKHAYFTLIQTFHVPLIRQESDLTQTSMESAENRHTANSSSGPEIESFPNIPQQKTSILDSFPISLSGDDVKPSVINFNQPLGSLKKSSQSVSVSKRSSRFDSVTLCLPPDESPVEDMIYRCPHCTSDCKLRFKFYEHLCYHYHYRCFQCGLCPFLAFSRSAVINHSKKLHTEEAVVYHLSKETFEKRIERVTNKSYVHVSEPHTERRLLAYERAKEKKKLAAIGKATKRKSRSTTTRKDKANKSVEVKLLKTVKKSSKVSAKKVVKKKQKKSSKLAVPVTKVIKNQSLMENSSGKSKWLICPYCRSQRKTQRAVETEIRYHIHYKPYCCPFCEMTSSSEFTIESHILRIHPGKEVMVKYERIEKKEMKFKELFERALVLSEALLKSEVTGNLKKKYANRIVRQKQLTSSSSSGNGQNCALESEDTSTKSNWMRML